METLIVKENGNEIIKSNLLFSIKMNNKLTIHKNFESYNQAKSKMDSIKTIFKHSKFEIIVTES